MTSNTRRLRRPLSTGLAVCALAAGFGLSGAGSFAPAGAHAVTACTPHSTGLAKGVEVEVTKAKAVSVKRLEVRQDTAKVRVRLAVTGVGTATGYGYADACPGGVSNPREIEQVMTWTGTKTVRMDYTASGRTTKLATRAAVREATKLSRAAAVQDISEATARATETRVRQLAEEASQAPPPPQG